MHTRRCSPGNYLVFTLPFTVGTIDVSPIGTMCTFFRLARGDDVLVVDCSVSAYRVCQKGLASIPRTYAHIVRHAKHVLPAPRSPLPSRPPRATFPPLCHIRKLKVWRDPITRTEKVEVALSLKQSVWLPQEMSSTSSSTSPDGRGGGSGGGRSRTGDGSGVSSSSPSSSSASAGRKRGYVFAPPYSVAASVVYQVCGRV